MLLAPLLFAQEAAAPEKCVFAGTVQDSVGGQAIARATVRLVSRKGGAASYIASTDAAGAFRFQAIAPGDYVIEVYARGYRAGVVAVKPGQFASWLHFNPGENVSDAVAALDPPAVISGRVTGADGEPMAGAMVEAMTRSWNSSATPLARDKGVETDERGEYRLSVEPGRYFLCAGPHSGRTPRVFSDGPGKPEMVVAGVFYPHLPDSTGAAEFDLHPGQQLGGVDFQLPAVAAYHVRGSIRPAADWRNGNALILQQRNGVSQFANGTPIKNDAFDFAGVPPGAYWLRVFSANSQRLGGKLAVDVADRDVDGLAFHVIPPGTLKGRVRFDDSDAHDLTAVNLFLNQLDWAFLNWGGSAGAKADGSFEFDNVPAGEFVLHMAEAGDAYLQSVTYNHRDAPGGKLDLSDGAAGELEVVLASGTGQIAGTVHWPDARPGAPPAAATNMSAVLAPVDSPTTFGVRSMGIDQSGRFRFSNMAPGQYYLWAAKNFDQRWWDAAYLEQMKSRGVRVDLPKKGNIQIEIPEVIE